MIQHQQTVKKKNILFRREINIMIICINMEVRSSQIEIV